MEPVEGLSGQKHEQQDTLEDAGHDLGNAHRDLRRVATHFGKRHNKTGDNDSQRVQARQKGNDDCGKAITERDIWL